MKKFYFIKIINSLKNLNNSPINYQTKINYQSKFVNLLNNRRLINYNTAYLIILKYTAISNNVYTNKNNEFNLLNFIWIYISVMLSLETVTIEVYKNFLFNKTYSNFSINMLHALSIIKYEDLKSKEIQINANNIIHIRKEFKASNVKILRKISLIDNLLKKYIETTLNTKVSINFDKYNILFLKKKSIFLKILKRKLRRIKKMLRYSKLSIRSFIRVSIIFLYAKDINLFSRVLLKVMNGMHYKNHRRFLYYLKLFISKVMNYYFEILKFEGFFFYLSGKISGGGNSKKKNYAVKCGKYSLTNKMLKLKYIKGLLHTKTGVLGFKFMISYI